MPDQITSLIQKRKRKSSSPLVRTRKWVQAAAMIVFGATLLWTRWGQLGPPASNLAVRLSPFSMITSSISSRTLLLGSTVALILLASSFVVGRAWCGWLCPLGTVLDLFPFSKLSKKTLRIPERMRSIKYGILLTAILAAIFSNLTLLFLDPLTILTRTFSVVLFPGLDRFVFWLERLLVNVPALSNGVYAFDQVLRPAVFPSTPPVFLYTSLVLGFFALLLALNVLAERFWCRYLCPLGAILGLGSKFSLIKRKVKESCTSCGVCESKCPTGTIDPNQGYRSDPAECTLCFNCLGTCKNSQFEFAFPSSSEKRHEYDPARRTFLASLGTVALGAALLKTKWLNLVNTHFSLRPPGAESDFLLAKCVRCGLCVKVCPTQALQFDPQNGGLEGFMTPVFVPRNGYCDYSCNSCGQICPVQAIPPIPLDEKRKTVIGKAVIDKEICLAWGEHTPCIVCEEMCPLPQKAITLDTQPFMDEHGKPFELQLPVVNLEICIGCGICEFKCPLPAEAAIRVHSQEFVRDS